MVYFKCIILNNFFFMVLSFLFVNACSSAEKETGELHTDQPSYKKIAEEKFNKDYKVESNKDSTYFIIYYSPKSKIKELNPPLKFFVYSINSRQIIFQDNLSNGKVQWKNNDELTVSTIPEIVKGGDEKNKQIFGYTYDVIKKRKLSSLEEN